jgi:hypothetical protein
MISRERFLETYPEFLAAPPAMIDRALADALEHVDADTFGTRLDVAHGLATAHLLALSPYAQEARIAGDDARTTYSVQLDRMRGVAAIGMRSW